MPKKRKTRRVKIISPKTKGVVSLAVVRRGLQEVQRQTWKGKLSSGGVKVLHNKLEELKDATDTMELSKKEEVSLDLTFKQTQRMVELSAKKALPKKAAVLSALKALEKHVKGLKLVTEKTEDEVEDKADALEKDIENLGAIGAITPKEKKELNERIEVLEDALEQKEEREEEPEEKEEEAGEKKKGKKKEQKEEEHEHEHEEEEEEEKEEKKEKESRPMSLLQVRRGIQSIQQKMKSAKSINDEQQNALEHELDHLNNAAEDLKDAGTISDDALRSFKQTIKKIGDEMDNKEE